jgi:tetratricopeptide (TPR) repeat protein
MVALNYPEIDVTDAYVRAHDMNPARAESLGELAHYLQVRGKRALAYAFSSIAKDIGPTNQKLFVDPSWSDWRNLDEYAVACYWMGKYKDSLQANEKLLKSKTLPESERGRVENNMRFSLRKITV